MRVHAGWRLVPAIALLAAGCSDDEKIVYRDRDLFNPPPDAASGFLGYYDSATKTTTCGNCHAGEQADWETTKHADAYDTLVQSGHAQDFCFECHTVSDAGNDIDTPAGWNAVQDAAYHDVQCESCHGPGNEHVQDPGASQPIASLAVADDLTTGCAECHSGTHHPFAEEWLQSGHSMVIESAAGNASCQGCHQGQGILAAWGVDATYVEEDGSEHLPVTCGICHDPHGSPYEHQLRFPVNTRDPELHLCARCHDRRSVPSATSSHGLEPHSPETALLLGEAGWFPPGADIDPGQIIASHGSDGNPKLCATCHVSRLAVTDAVTGAFTFQATGHLFTAIPCVDASGIPTTGDCDYNTTDRSFAACATGGCHTNETTAASALTAATLSIQAWSDDLLALLTTVDPNLDAAGGEIDPTLTTFTVAEGALFNYNLANHGGSIYPATVHNPFLIEALLVASIAEVEDTYGLSAGRGVDYRAELDRLLGRAGR